MAKINESKQSKALHAFLQGKRPTVVRQIGTSGTSEADLIEKSLNRNSQKCGGGIRILRKKIEG